MMFEELITKYFPTEESLNSVADEFSAELRFASNRVEQGNDVYQYLLSVTDSQEQLNQLVVLLCSTYAETEFHDSMALTVANRFDFTMEDFIDEQLPN